MAAHLVFPSVAWFEALGAEMVADAATHRRIGEIDLSCALTFFEVPGRGDVTIRLTFEEFELVGVEDVGDDLDPEDVDFVIEGYHDDWQTMVEHLAEHGGRPGREFTLNYLSLPGVPLRCWSPDPLGRDMFFRFNQSLQVFVNASHRLATEFPAPVG